MATKIQGVELPSTLRKSPPQAQRTYAKAKPNAAKEYGGGERARRTAYAALKNSFEKVGDHLEAKAQSGPSDAQSRQSAANKRAGKGETCGGVDVEHDTRKDLYQRAPAIGLPVRSTMKKNEIAGLLARRQA